MKLLITLVIIIGIAAVAGSIVVGLKSFDGTVTENPYEKGLLWDDVQEKMNDLGWSIEIHGKEFTAGDNDVLISILDKNNLPLALAEVTLRISRPATATFNQYFDIIQVGNGVFSARLNFPLFGYWDIGVHVSSGGDTLYFEKRVFINKGERTS